MDVLSASRPRRRRGPGVSLRKEGDRYVGRIALPRLPGGRRPVKRVTADSPWGVGSKLARRVGTSVSQRSDQVWRRATVSWRSTPDFLMIGAQRTGSTSLYEWLCDQGRVGRAAGKELHYFDRYYERGATWYRAQFPLARRGRLAAEATPDLLFHPLVPGRVARDLPGDVRFVVVLRDPVERAISHYWLQRRRRVETEDLAVALALEPERLAGQWDLVLAGERSTAWEHYSYVARGEYAGQLQRWFDIFDRDRFHITTSERLFGSQSHRDDLVRWLGLPPTPAPFAVHNDAPRRTAPDPNVLQVLRNHFVPHNEALFDLLGERLWST